METIMRFFALLAIAGLGVGPAVAKECRTPDLPEGVRVQLPAECKDPVRTGSGRTNEQARLRSDSGMIDLGNGTKVQIGGRVRAEMGVRR
jgi:hypothetical protein